MHAHPQVLTLHSNRTARPSKVTTKSRLSLDTQLQKELVSSKDSRKSIQISKSKRHEHLNR
nr:MAG TPA: hypothetical protein [Caudoviricetes sp.]